MNRRQKSKHPLRRWLTLNGYTVQRWCDKYGFRRRTIESYIGLYRNPCVKMAQAISDATDGEVTREQIAWPRDYLEEDA